MPPEENVQQLSTLAVLIRAGGVPMFGLGILFSLWGILNVVRPRNRHLILVQTLLSLLPGIFAMMAIYAACREFNMMATLPAAPKPGEIAAVAGFAMSCGFFGIAGTIMPVTLGMVASWRLGFFSPGSRDR